MLWRFKRLVGIGVLLACVLSFLSFVRVGPSGVTYRKSEKWVSYETLFVTQRGFPWGRSVVPDGTHGTQPKATQSFADPTRLSSLAVLYSQLAVGDEVRALMRRHGPIHGTIEAAPVLATQNGNGDALPLVSIAAFDDTAPHAAALAQRAGSALDAYIVAQQDDNAIAVRDRVLLTVVKRPSAESAKLFQGRSKTLPIVVLVAVLGATLALAFVLENLRTRPEAEEEPQARADERVLAETLPRRTA